MNIKYYGFEYWQLWELEENGIEVDVVLIPGSIVLTKKLGEKTNFVTFKVPRNEKYFTEELNRALDKLTLLQ
jgi:hypothetical protein